MLFEKVIDKDVSDWFMFQRNRSVLWQTVENGMSNASARFTISGNTTRYLGLVPAAGKRCFLYGRTLTVSAGTFNVDVVSLSSYTLGAQEATIAALRQGGTPITSKVYTNVTNPVGESVIEYGFIEVGEGIGNTSARSVVDNQDLVKVFSNPSFLKVENTSNDDSICTINVLLWEEDV